MTAPPIGTVAPASTAAGGGALGALVGLANFVYTIVKDHGHQCKFTSKDAGPGVSTVPKDLPVRIESRHELGGVWYTHTRAWASAAKSLYSHTKTTNPKKLTSSYLCVIFPFKISYAVAVPDLEKLDVEITTLKVEIAKGKLEAKQTVRKQLEDEAAKLGKEPAAPKVPVDPGPAPDAPVPPPVPDAYRLPDARGDGGPTVEETQYDLAKQQHDTVAVPDHDQRTLAWDAAKKKYDEDMPGYREAKSKYDEDKAAWDLKKLDHDEVVQLVNDLGASLKANLDAKDELRKRKQALRDKVAQHADVEYMTNVHLSGADGWHGLRSKGWQNVKVDASFALRADEVGEGTSPTVTIDMNWAESAIGYAKPWSGSITVAPKQAQVTGSGKFATRFNQLAHLENL